MKYTNANSCVSMCLVLLMALTTLAQTAPMPEKKLIVWGGIDWYSPEKVQMNIRKIEELPFDGMVLQGFKTTREKDGKPIYFDWECFGQEQWERDELTPAINVLKNIDFQRFTDNFLRFNVTPGNVDWFDDFSAILHNARLWAAVAQETGMKGWAFDVEDYKGTVFSYKKMKYAKEKSFDEYAQQARRRGREFMEAVEQGNPEIVLLLMLAHSYVYRDIQAGRPLTEIQYGLLPAFLNGLIEAAGPDVKIIDGQEQGYGYLTSEDYYRGYHVTWQDALVLVPPELRAKYRAKMEVGIAMFVNYVFGISDWPGHYPTHYLTPEERMRIFEQNVYYALTVTNEYVWLYSEHIGWWEKEGYNYPTPDGTLDAVRSARQKIRQGEPLGFDVSPQRIAAAKATLKLANPYPSRDSFLLSAPAGKPTPKIDGVLDDAVWRDIPELLPFVRMAQEPGKAKATTIARATFDDGNLYLAFRCAEQEPTQLRSAGKNKDDDLLQGDCVEVFIKAGERSLPYHFIVNPWNVQWDGKGDFAGWDGQWRSGAHMGATEWTVEIAIPWREIGGRPASRSLRTFLCRRNATANQLDAVVQILTLPAEPPAK